MKISHLVALGALTLGMTSVVRAEDPNIAGPNSFLRVLHGISNSPKVDVYIDGKKKLNDIEFDTLSKYLRFRSGYHSYRITSNNPSRTLVSGARNFRGGDFYTVGAYGTLVNRRIFIHNDSTGNPPYGRASLTVSHLSPGSRPVDVALFLPGGRISKVIRGLRYGQTRTVPVPASDMSVRLMRGNAIIKTVTGVSPREGRKYAAYAIGRPGRNFKLLLNVTASQ